MEWQMISLILCIFGILREIRPAEVFVTNYLTHWKNFTSSDINQKIFPVSTYSNFTTLIIVFLLIDMIRYKPFIIISSLSGAICFLTLQLGTTMNQMYFVEFAYGLLLSTEVSYYTYIYAKVDKKYYQKVTSYARVAHLIGRCMSSFVAQLTISFHVLNLEHLNYITITSLSLATLWAFLLPSVQHSLYFNRVDLDSTCNTPKSYENGSISNIPSTSEPKASTSRTSTSIFKKMKSALILLWSDFTKAYSNKYVLKWSLWWAFASCGFFQVINYIQLLWQDATEIHQKNIKDYDIYNGVVEGLYALISFIAVFAIGNLHLNWPLVGEAILSIFSIFEGILLVLSYITYNIWILYTVYIAFGVIYHAMITIANFEVAKHITKDSYGLVFGINTFIALLLQTILTTIIVNKSLNLDIKTQFLIIGGYFIILGIIFMIMSKYTINKYCKQQQSIKIWLKRIDSDIKLQEGEKELS